jgi:hypothetical protein
MRYAVKQFVHSNGLSGRSSGASGCLASFVASSRMSVAQMHSRTGAIVSLTESWCCGLDSNQRSADYESAALDQLCYRSVFHTGCVSMRLTVPAESVCSITDPSSATR